MEINGDSLLHASTVCVENGRRLYRDADWLAADGSPTAYALCILAQEEFAKAFLLYLVREGIVPWSDGVRHSLLQHKEKQLLGIIMEWLSPNDDEYLARMAATPRTRSLPVHVSDAIRIYVERIKPRSQVTYPSGSCDPYTARVARGDMDSEKQDALYVRLSDNAEVISVPSEVSEEVVRQALEKTRRLADLVEPIKKGRLCSAIDYEMVASALRLFSLDKRYRPFLTWKDTLFSDAHSIGAVLENTSDQPASQVRGYLAVFVGREIMPPLFRIEAFEVDSWSSVSLTLPVSHEAHTVAVAHSDGFDLHLHLEYQGDQSSMYGVEGWIAYDPSTQSFHARLEHF